MIGSISLSSSSLPGLFHPLVRVLAFSMIVVLLAVRLGSFSEEVFVTPIEDAIFDVAFVSADEKGPQTKPQAVKSKRALDCDLMQYEVPLFKLILVDVALTGHVPRFSTEDLAYEIFIPPEAVV